MDMNPSSAPPTASPYYDIQAERSVLGTILIDNATISEAVGVGITPQAFSLERHQILFRAMLDLERGGQPIDLVTLTSHLNQLQQFQAVGGTQTLTELVEESFQMRHIAGYSRIVMERAQLRKLSQACSQIHSEISNGVPDVPGFLNSAEACVFEATQAGALSDGLVSVRSALHEFVAEVEKRSIAGSDLVGLRTGFHEVDRFTNGLRPHQVWVVAARPGMGKTSFVLSIVQNVGIRNAGVVAMFSMEMKRSELMF